MRFKEAVNRFWGHCHAWERLVEGVSMLQMVDFQVNNLGDRTSVVDNGGKMPSCMLPQSPFWARKGPCSDVEPVSECFRTRYTLPQESFVAF